MSQTFGLMTKPIPARLGASLVTLLTGVTLATVLAAAWLPAQPPVWWAGASATLAIAMVLIAGALGARPARVRQPKWAKSFVRTSLAAAIVVPLIALFPAASSPEIGKWVMAAIAGAEVLLLATTIALIAALRVR